MSNLQHRQDIIKAKRMKTPWKNFVMEICSWFPLMFYKNNGFMSRFPVSERVGKIIDYKDFENYGGDFIQFGLDCDDSFFASFRDLYRNMVFTPMFTYGGNENSTFTDWTLGAKNSYLSSTLINTVENVLYSFCIKENCSNVMNSGIVWKNCNNIFNSRLIINSFNVFYSQHIINSSDVRFSSNLVGCHNCICCDNLENQSYCIANKEYSKENFEQEKEAYIKSIIINYNQNFEIDTNIECYDSSNSLFGYQLKNTRNTILIGGKLLNSHFYDCVNAGGSNAGENHDFYAVLGGGNGSSNIYCCMNFLNCSTIFYSSNLVNCSFCLGCIGLKNKSHCILNKQYTKEERYVKVDEIFGSMYADGTLGDFFPASMNPFYFNDTAAYLIGSSPAGTTTKGGGQTFTKEEVIAKSYLRRDEPIKVDIPEGALVIKTSELDRFEGWKPQPVIASEAKQSINHFDEIASSSAHGSHSPRNDADSNFEGQQWHIDPEILKYIIQDEQGNVYRIVKMEYDFLMKYGLPLPRKHRLDRMKENFRIN